MSDAPARDLVEKDEALSAGFAQGAAVIEAQLKLLPLGPGVYRMIDRHGNALYVGKARSVKKRVASYVQLPRLSTRLKRMVSETAQLEVVQTHTEVEALLLECNLIKKLKPRYNVLLRDDKSFPYILATGDHDFPRLVKYRGARNRPGDYFGPFASAGAVGRTLTALQRAFLLRNCSDAVFAQRTRPCLQYQIKRCTAPCVARISKEDYAASVRQARDFLTGKSGQVQAELAAEMERASAALDFETAARTRDRLRALAQIRSHQDINIEGLDDADVVALAQDAGQTCVQVFFFRSGSNFGNRAYFPSHDKALPVDEIMAAFLGQFYAGRPPPKLILTSQAPAERALLEEALSVKAERRVEIAAPQRGAKANLVEHALLNAREALARRLAEGSSQRRLLEMLGEGFRLSTVPKRIEVYDNSHIMGTAAIGAMIVAGPEGFQKNAYRKFNIREAKPGDDFAMMREVLTRRFSRALKEDPERAEGTWPDLVLIDGGKGQLSAAQGVLVELGATGVPMVAIAKGEDRDAGRERFFLPDGGEVTLAQDDPLRYFLQRLRDEAHRFAVETHRAKRAKPLGGSELDEIAGIGAKRRKALLLHFGSVREIARAGLADLEKVEGISGAVAQKIYSYFHESG
ncbi:MAG: excinuclease ABC subunit UvrC [Alphaproteobacteria bacterium]|nr:excinuclease ABC subunit UvrC [Alphaproteobacteria bacterium]